MTDRRKSPRIEITSTAQLQVLSQNPEGRRPAIPVRIMDKSDKGLRLLSPAALAADAAVMIDLGETVILAEVCYCEEDVTDPDNPYSVGVMTQEVVTGLSSLQHLASALEEDRSNAADRSNVADRRTVKEPAPQG